MNTKGFSLHVALKIIVGHTDAELHVLVNVHHAAVGIVLGVDLPGEDLVGGDGGHHVRGSAVDGDVVAGAELEGASHVADDEEGVLNLGQGCRCVVGEPWTEALTINFFKALPPAHAISSVGVIKGVTTIRCSEAEVSAGLHGGNVLEKGLVLGIVLMYWIRQKKGAARHPIHSMSL